RESATPPHGGPCAWRPEDPGAAPCGRLHQGAQEEICGGPGLPAARGYGEAEATDPARGRAHAAVDGPFGARAGAEAQQGAPPAPPYLANVRSLRARRARLPSLG